MIVPALQIANKIPDVYLQLWASSLLKGRYLSRFIQHFYFLFYFLFVSRFHFMLLYIS